MKCDWVRQNIVFYVYNELEDDARYEVEQHLARCPECATELKATRKFHATLSEMPVAEPSELAGGLAHAAAGSVGNDSARSLLASADS